TSPTLQLSLRLPLTSPLPHPNLQSFPTRRSSDLKERNEDAAGARLRSPRRHRRVARQILGRQASRRRAGASRPAARSLSSQNLRSEEHTSELQSQSNLVCRLLLEKKKKNKVQSTI